jgi:hypothetical protein
MAENLIKKGFQPFFIYSKIELGAVLGVITPMLKKQL